MTLVKLFNLFWAMMPALVSSPLDAPCIHWGLLTGSPVIVEDPKTLHPGAYFAAGAWGVKVCRGGIKLPPKALLAALLHEFGHLDQLAKFDFLPNTPAKKVEGEAYADEFMFANLSQFGLTCEAVKAFLVAHRDKETKGEALARKLMVNAFGKWADPHGSDAERIDACKAALGPD